MSVPRRRRLPLLVAVVILLIAAAARSIGLTEGFVFDEWYTAQLVSFGKGVGTMLDQVVAQDAHPPLYYLGIWAVSQAAGFGDALGYRSGIEWVLRLPSVLLGLGSIGLLMMIAWRAFSRNVALLAGALAALNVLMIDRDTEARMYSLFVLLTLLGVVLLRRAIERNRVGDWLLYAIVATGLLYTHYLAAFVLIGHAVYAAAHLRRTGARALIAFLAAIAFVPWLPVLLGSMAAGRTNLAIREPLATVASNLVHWLLAPHNDALLLRAVTYLAWALIVWGLALAFRKGETRLLVVATLLVPFALWWIVSALWVNVTGTRYLPIFFPWLLLALALGAVDVSRRLGRLGVVAPLLLLAVSTQSVAHLALVPEGSDWKGLRERAQIRIRDDDAIVSNSLINATLAGYYLIEDGASPPVLVVDDPRRMPLELLASRNRIWYVKGAFGPWDPRNWTEDEEAFFVRWSNDTTTLERVFFVSRDVALVELRPIAVAEE